MARENRLIAALCVMILILDAWIVAGALGTTEFDDAFMVARYAAHFLEGHGFSWNTADGPSFGVTSPGHLIVVTAIMALSEWNDAEVISVASYGAGYLALIAMAALCLLVQRAAGKQVTWRPVLLIPTLLVLSPFHYHCVTGMDTMLSLLANAMLACATVVLSWKPTYRTLLLCSVVAVFAFVARPDNGVYSMLLPPLYLMARNRHSWRWACCFLGLTSVGLVAALVAFHLAFGDFLPLPIYAKRTGFLAGYTGAYQWNAMREMLVFHTGSVAFTIAAVATVQRSAASRVAAALIPAGLTFAFFTTIVQVMGWNARFYVPSLPWIVLAAMTAMAEYSRPREMRSFNRGSVARLLVIGVLAMMAFPGPHQRALVKWWQHHVIGPPRVELPQTRYHILSGYRVEKLGWKTSVMGIADLLELVPPEVVIAASEHGIIGSRQKDRTIIDLLGLHDRTIAHRGFDSSYLMDRHPDLIWMPNSDYTATIAAILDDPIFKRTYDFYPGLYDYGIAIRIDGHHRDSLKAALVSELNRIYGVSAIEPFQAFPDR